MRHRDESFLLPVSLQGGAQPAAPLCVPAGRRGGDGEEGPQGGGGGELGP